MRGRGLINAPTFNLMISQSTGSSSQHYYSGSAGYENHPLPPPHISGLPHFQHVPHPQQPQPAPGHVYPPLPQPTLHRPPDSTVNFAPLLPAQGSGDTRIPLPTMLTRPPPPAHSTAVDGYRDVGTAFSANPLNQQLIFGRIQPQAAEESTNASVPSPELVVSVADERMWNAPSEPRLPPFTVGVTEEDPAVTVKGRKSRKALTRDSASAGDPSTCGVTDRTNPEVTFQFGVFPPLNGTSGSTSGQSGAPDQAGSVELESLRSNTGDEWQVRDFGYGFGHNGSGNAPSVIREEITTREQQRVQERGHREDQERESGEGPQDRPRRPSFNGGHERGSYERGGYERGGYLGRRGRGSNPNGGYGRGGYGRGFSRGGYGQYPRQHQYSATPPGQFSQLPSNTTHGYSPDQSVYFLPPPPPPPPPPSGFGSYLPGGYEVYQYPSFPPPPALYPPVPQPISQLPFAIDPTRYYLLGQLEYYLSPQNMAQDFYLRRQASTTY